MKKETTSRRSALAEDELDQVVGGYAGVVSSDGTVVVVAPDDPSEHSGAIEVNWQDPTEESRKRAQEMIERSRKVVESWGENGPLLNTLDSLKPQT